jgi:hypothetical protein
MARWAEIAFLARRAVAEHDHHGFVVPSSPFPCLNCTAFLHSLPFHLFKFYSSMLRLGVRWFILAVILAENRAAALVRAEGDVWTNLAYGCRMAGACTMVVMRRGWSGGGRGDGHKSIESVRMDSAVFLYHHYPPRRSPLPDELNYLLSLLTPRRLLIPNGSISSIPLVSCSIPRFTSAR